MNPKIDQALTAGQRLSQLLTRIGAALARWAAVQSWGRLIVLAVLALIAESIVTDNILHWNDSPSRTRIHKHAPKVHSSSSEDEGEEDVQIGWDGIKVISRKGTKKTPAGADAAGSSPPAADRTAAAPAGSSNGSTNPPPPGPAANTLPGSDSAASTTPPNPASSAATPPATPSRPATINVRIEGDKASGDEDSDEDISVELPRHRTLGRWAKDVVEGLLLLLIVFVLASKIVMRQTARSDARAAQAEASAAAAAADAERETLHRQLAEAQLQTLQAQVEPHFLFNTLASVDYLIETDPARASAMQKNLIQYLRAALPQMRTQSSQLGREGDLSRAYLEILKMRMEDRLQVVVDIPEGLRSAEFPPMMLQTLVENAIQHGVEPKPEGGEVKVSGRVVDGHLEVSVADTGVGLAGSGTRSTAGGGVGLSNVRERLTRLYGTQASFRLQAGQTAGAVATIRLPYRVVSSDAGKAGPAPAASSQGAPA